MKKYIVILKDSSGEAPEKALIIRHVDHLKRLDAKGLLYICGPLKGNGEALQIIFAETMEEASLLVNEDPFIQEGFYRQFSISELIEANEANNYLL